MIKTERGYTLVELLIVLAITGIIFTVIGGAIYQLSTVSAYGNDSMTANHELQNVAYNFNMDGQKATAAVGSTSLTLTVPSSQNIVYSLTGKTLQRTVGSAVTTLAQNITNASFSVQGRLVSMDITSAPTGRYNVSVQQVYKVYMRPVAQ
jgi:prepilin-type N-terminal cleavage/methylation domain-containing protein